MYAINKCYDDGADDDDDVASFVADDFRDAVGVLDPDVCLGQRKSMSGDGCVDGSVQRLGSVDGV